MSAAALFRGRSAHGSSRRIENARRGERGSTDSSRCAGRPQP